MLGIRGSRYAVLNVYNLILVLSFTQLVHCTADDDLVKVKVYTDKALLVGELYWYHVATEVSGGGAWLRGVGCLSNDTCAFLNSDQNNAIKVGGYQSCINSSSCVEQRFTAAVVDPVQVLKLKIRRDENGKILEVTASCSNRIGYTLWTSDGASQYMRFTYSELEDNGTWTGHYKCERDSTATISSITSEPTNDSTGTAEPPNTSPTLTSVPPHPEMSTGSYNLTISQNTSSTGGQNSTPMTGATSESTNRDLNQTKRADKTSSGPNVTTIIVPVVVGGVAVVALVAAVLVLCRRRKRKAESPPMKSGPVIQNSVYCSANARAEDYNVISMEEPNQSPVDQQNAETNPNGSAKDDPDNSSELSYQLLVRSMGDNPTFKKDSSNPAPPEEYTAVVKPNSHKVNNESQAEELYCEVDTTPTDVFLPEVDLVENDLYDSFRDEIEPPSEYYNL